MSEYLIFGVIVLVVFVFLIGVIQLAKAVFNKLNEKFGD